MGVWEAGTLPLNAAGKWHGPSCCLPVIKSEDASFSWLPTSPVLVAVSDLATVPELAFPHRSVIEQTGTLLSSLSPHTSNHHHRFCHPTSSTPFLPPDLRRTRTQYARTHTQAFTQPMHDEGRQRVPGQ